MTETIKITNGYLDNIVNSAVISTITKKSFSAKTSYWIARVLDKVQREAKVYFAERQKLIDKYAKRHDIDGEGFKKGDIISDGQNVTLNNPTEFQKEITELTEIEIEIGLNRVEFDLEKEPACTIEEMTLLLPLIEKK